MPPSSRWSGFAHGTSHFFHFMIPPLFPWLMTEFGLGFTQVGLTMTMFFVVSGAGQALAGFVVDRFGALRVLAGGILLLSASGLVLASAQNFAMLLAAAMVAGPGTCLYYMVHTYPQFILWFGTAKIDLWWGIAPISAGVFGVPIGILTILVVSMLTPEPSKEVQEFVEHVRYPNLRGDTGETLAR